MNSESRSVGESRPESPAGMPHSRADDAASSTRARNPLVDETRSEAAPGKASPRVAVLIPCHNEAQTISEVVRDFSKNCPQARIYVYDNASTDNTLEVARRAGALVGRECRRGKGYVMRTMFRQIDADIYVMVDGDGTYPAERIGDLIGPVANGDADMVIGARLAPGSEPGFTLPRLLGNRLFRYLVSAIFRIEISDLLSGYRALNRRVAKTLPFLSHGFEIETELTVKCLVRGYQVGEVPVELSPRPTGSQSKIRIFRDGLLIFQTIFALLRDYKPLTAFGSLGLVVMASGLVPGFLVIDEFLRTGEILRTPSAILSVGLVLSGLFVGFMGLVLHTIARRFQELDHQLQRVSEHQFDSGRFDSGTSDSGTSSQSS